MIKAAEAIVSVFVFMILLQLLAQLVIEQPLLNNPNGTFNFDLRLEIPFNELMEITRRLSPHHRLEW
jgi:hypothetical protein